MFKVGDKVRCVNCDSTLGALEKNKVYTVKKIIGDLLQVGITPDGYFDTRFELVKEEPKEVKVGDVWVSEDKKDAVKIVGEFISGGGADCLSYVHLNGYRKGRPWECLKITVQKLYPILVHREPPKQKKQPKPQQVKAKKEEKWERVFQANDVFRCGNKIKVAENGFEGFAECNKKDKFDLMFGVNLAAHRARVKYHQWVIEKMLKEGAK